MQTLLSAPANGHTLLYIYSGYPVAGASHKLFDIERDNIAVTQMITTPALLMVRDDSPYKSLPEIIAQARKQPALLIRR